MSLIGALVGAIAAPVIGGIFGNKQSKDQNKYDREAAERQYQFDEEAYERTREDQIKDQHALLPRLRESAERAGFNPLTALGYTGGSGFGMTGTAAPSKKAVAKLATPSLAGLALSGAADWYRTASEQSRTHREAAEQIKEINADRTLQTNPNRTTVQNTRTAIKTETLPSLGTPPDRPHDVVEEKTTWLEQGPLLGTNPSWYGKEGQTYIDPRRPDAEHGEQRYGDIAQEITGGANMVKDFTYNWQLQSVAEDYGRNVADQVNQKIAENPSLRVQEAIEQVTKGKPKKSVRPKAPNYPGKTNVNVPPRAYYGPPGSRTGF